MKLEIARVTNFRSVEDSGEFSLHDITCLVGKNEAGKTAILQALAGLNPHPATPFTYDVERDYPRRNLTRYTATHGQDEAVVIETKWRLLDEEHAAVIAVFGEHALTDSLVVVRRRYRKEPEWELPIDFANAVKHLIEDERLTAAEKSPLKDASNTQTLIKALEALQARSDKQQRLLDRVKAFPGSSITGLVRSCLSLPQFMIFSHYDRMEGQIRLDTYAGRANGSQQPPIATGERVFVDFLNFAGTSIGEIVSATTYESLNARCEAASLTITNQLREYWTQNPHLDIEVRVTKAENGDPAPFNAGIIARARVKNNLHGVTVPFSERSAGFIWFFSFLVKFAQVEAAPGKVILLLDEPGLTLHGKAQADLLRYFEETLAPDYQLIFTTHSPFMVPPDKLPTVRLVEDRLTSPRPGLWKSEGTKVRSDALATDRDTLFPLQGALGYELTQSLFVGKNTLLVEGPSDILYLQAFSAALGRRGKRGLSREWTLCPAGGLDKIQSFVSLFGGAGLNIAALTDFAKPDRRKLDRLAENKVLEGGRLLTYATLLGLEEADVEDIFDPATFAGLLNQAYALPADRQLTGESLAAIEPDNPRLLKKAEAAFRLMPSEVAEFDHFRPSEWLFLHPEILDSGDVERTLERAEKVVAALNGLL